jgi:hypothetical protein
MDKRIGQPSTDPENLEEFACFIRDQAAANAVGIPASFLKNIKRRDGVVRITLRPPNRYPYPMGYLY